MAETDTPQVPRYTWLSGGGHAGLPPGTFIGDGPQLVEILDPPLADGTCYRIVHTLPPALGGPDLVPDVTAEEPATPESSAPDASAPRRQAKRA